MQRKLVLSPIVPSNELYVMTKCKVKSKAFYWKKGSHKVE